MADDKNRGMANDRQCSSKSMIDAAVAASRRRDLQDLGVAGTPSSPDHGGMTGWGLVVLAPIAAITAALTNAYVSRTKAEKPISDLHATLATLTMTLSDLPAEASGREPVVAAIAQVTYQLERQHRLLSMREEALERARSSVKGLLVLSCVWLLFGVVGSHGDVSVMLSDPGFFQWGAFFMISGLILGRFDA
ncbi:hypothetical protein [Nocardia yamanashiensis]|uniref:hypothetical protein n=1 Tax=Nocardia yamanashiensis TaxID=209247 RepID=UPI0012FE24CB|nr:hypothetical protein [Nocardia yamanashiensis]